MATKRNKPPSSSAKSIAKGGIDITPDLSPEQRQDLRHKNAEALMAHPAFADGAYGEFIADAAFNKNGDYSPSVQTHALGVASDVIYGKHRGQEEVSKISPMLQIQLVGRSFDPTTGEVGLSRNEALGLSKREYMIQQYGIEIDDDPTFGKEGDSNGSE